MPKKTLKKRHDDIQQRRLILWEVLKRTPYFDEFRKNNLPRIENEIEWQKELDKSLSPSLHSCDDVEAKLIEAFLKDTKGSLMANRLGLMYDSSDIPIKVISSKKAAIKEGRLDLSPHIEKNRYLVLRVDLHKSKQTLEESFDRVLKVYHKKVRGKPKGKTTILLEDDIRAYDAILKNNGSIQKATWELYPELHGIRMNPGRVQATIKTEKRDREYSEKYRITKNSNKKIKDLINKASLLANSIGESPL